MISKMGYYAQIMCFYFYHALSQIMLQSTLRWLSESSLRFGCAMLVQLLNWLHVLDYRNFGNTEGW